MLLFLVPAALAAPDGETPERAARLLRTRILSGPVFREDTTTGAFFEIGVEAVGRGAVHLDVGVSATTPHMFTLPGPRRTYGSVDGLLDLGFDVGRYATTGPTVGLAYRFFNQQGQAIDNVTMGLVGWMGRVALLQSRSFGIVLGARGLVDTRAVDLVLATSQVQRMPRVEARVGLGIFFGRRRSE